jgi:hypothetical protein
MWFLGKRAKQERFKRKWKRQYSPGGVILPIDAVPNEFISIPEKELPELVERYVRAMETQRTDDWCRCEWTIHPDDTELPKGKRRKIRSDTHPECPVHTKEGFLRYFFEWVFTNDR